MASILAFPAGSAARRSLPQQTGLQNSSAEILLFTGVFYQRLGDTPKADDRRCNMRKADEAKSG